MFGHPRTPQVQSGDMTLPTREIMQFGGVRLKVEQLFAARMHEPDVLPAPLFCSNL